MSYKSRCEACGTPFYEEEIPPNHACARRPEPEPTPKERAEAAYQQTLRMRALNQKLREMGIGADPRKDAAPQPPTVSSSPPVGEDREKWLKEMHAEAGVFATKDPRKRAQATRSVSFMAGALWCYDDSSVASRLAQAEERVRELERDVRLQFYGRKQEEEFHAAAQARIAELENRCGEWSEDFRKEHDERVAALAAGKTCEGEGK